MTLREVHEQFRIPLRDLKNDTKSGLAPFVPVGKGEKRVHRRMTAAHVRDYLARRAQRGAAAAQDAEAAPVDPVRQAQEATKRRLARRTGHRASNR